MANTRRGYQRHRFFSNPRFQLRLILVFALLAAFYGVVNYYVSMHALETLRTDILALDLQPQARSDVEILVQQSETPLALQIGLITALCFAMLVLAGVYISHKIGGPAGRLSRYMQSLMDGWGTPHPIRFRKLDFLAELAAVFNAFQRHVGVLPGSQAEEQTTGDRTSPAEGEGATREGVS